MNTNGTIQVCHFLLPVGDLIGELVDVHVAGLVGGLFTGLVGSFIWWLVGDLVCGLLTFLVAS